MLRTLELGDIRTRLVQCSLGVTHGLLSEQSTVITRTEITIPAVVKARIPQRVFLCLLRGVNRE